MAENSQKWLNTGKKNFQFAKIFTLVHLCALYGLLVHSLYESVIVLPMYQLFLFSTDLSTGTLVLGPPFHLSSQKNKRHKKTNKNKKKKQKNKQKNRQQTNKQTNKEGNKQINKWTNK